MSATVKTSTRLKNKRRPGDPWISKNRVLNGGVGKSKRNCPIYRNPNFDTDETKLLIQLWGDPKVQRELITTHKKHVVISQLSAKMEEYGYYRSPEEITTRIKNMKCFYNRLKKEMETTNNLDPSWRHYAEMDAIMTRPIFSVRPNEVPAPSLKYLLEQEQEKRKERKRKAEEEGSVISDSDEDIDDILAVPSTVSGAKTKENGTKEPPNADSTNEAEETLTDDSGLSTTQETEKQRKLSNDDNKNEKSLVSDAEMAIKMEIESEQFQEYQTIEESDELVKTTKNNSSEEPIKTITISEDEDLLVPKMEPIDVDDEEFIQTEKTTPSVQTSAKQNFTQLADILKQPVKGQKIPAPAMIKFSLPSNSSTVTISSASSSISSQSKISVVSPTILMAPQMTTSKSSLATPTDQRQVRLPGNLHALLAASGSRATVSNANGMKFLLVNATDQIGSITAANLMSTGGALTATNRSNAVTNQSNVKIIQNSTQLQQQQQHQQQQQNQQIIQQHQQQQKQKQQQQNKNISPKSQSSPQEKNIPSKPKEALKRADIRQEYREQLKKRDLLGIKTALIKMLKLQEDANEIQTERLAIERERLQYERSIADRFLNIIEQNQKIQQQLQQQQQQQQATQPHIQLQQRPGTGSQVFTTNSGQATVTSNGQLMLPPKLLITTMVPNSAAQTVAGTTSTILTTTGFTNKGSSSSNNDLQLVVPKEEPQN